MDIKKKGGRLRWLSRLASTELTITCLGLAMALVLLGTLAQVRMGAFAAQKEFFNSWWIFGRVAGLSAPVFPGGLLVGTLWMANLLAAFAVRFKLRWRKMGILLSHFGVILLLMGQFLTQALARESSMPIEIGQTLQYSENVREMELALTMTSDPDSDQATRIPYSVFSRRRDISPPGLPFSLVVRRFYPNAEIRMAGPDEPGFATQGIGTRMAAQALPPASSDDEMNAVTAYVEVLEGRRSLGTWLVSSGLGAPQSFNVQGREYQIAIRPRRTYYPFSLTLKEFHHDRYPGTDIPKNFSSLVRLSNVENRESRDALIYMNHPLRYDGKTFYQASFGQGDRLSVFQVVENPVAWAPYASCALVCLGLAIQFVTRLLAFARQRRGEDR